MVPGGMQEKDEEPQHHGYYMASSRQERPDHQSDVELASQGLGDTMAVLSSYEMRQVSTSETRRKACATFADRQYRFSESQA